jgi:hypothetical protein
MPAPKGNQYAKGNKGGLGNPGKFKPAFVEQAKKACEAGFTDMELADLFGVSEHTINSWKLAHKEFGSALKAGKSAADERVERSLYHKATGYTFEAEKVFQFQGTIVRAKTREHVPPSETAMIFWLKNRRPEQWRDKSEQVIRHEHVNQMSDDELSRIATGSGDGAVETAKGKKELH